MTTVFHLAWPPAAAAALVQAWQAWAPEARRDRRHPAVDRRRRRAAARGRGGRHRARRPGRRRPPRRAGRPCGGRPDQASRQHLPCEAGDLEGLGSVEDRPERSGPGSHRSRATSTPSRSSSADPAGRHRGGAGRAPHPRLGARSVAGGGLPAWAAPTTGCPPTPSPTAANASWSSTWSKSAPTLRPGQRDTARDWLARSWALVHPWGSGGVCPDFPDPDLQDWARAYTGPNHDRLRRVKAAYDPGGFTVAVACVAARLPARSRRLSCASYGRAAARGWCG